MPRFRFPAPGGQSGALQSCKSRAHRAHDEEPHPSPSLLPYEGGGEERGGEKRPVQLIAPFTVSINCLSENGLGRKTNSWPWGRFLAKASSAYPETKMILAERPRLRNSVSMVGPSISGMMTSETIRSILPPASSTTLSASRPESASRTV